MPNLKDISKLFTDNKNIVSKANIAAQTASKLSKSKSIFDSLAVLMNSFDKLNKIREKEQKQKNKDIIVREIEAPTEILSLTQNADANQFFENIIYDVEANKYNFTYNKMMYKVFYEATKKFRLSSSDSEKQDLGKILVATHAQLVNLLNKEYKTDENVISAILIKRSV